VLRRHRGGCAGTFCRYPCRIHDGDGEAVFRVVQDEEARDIGQALFLVFRITRDPLDTRRLKSRNVCRHRVDEGVFARMDAGLRGHLDTPFPLFTEHVLQCVDYLAHRQACRLDVLP